MLLLEINNLTKHFGGLVALTDLNLNVHEGEILGLIGPNGAGKSTVFNMISGIFPPTRGICSFKGGDITGLPPHRIAKKGIARVFQGNVLFRNFTVLTNVLVGLHLHAKIGFWGSFFDTPYSHSCQEALHKRAMEILDLVGLSQKADELAANLPHGNQRLLCLAIALASEPELLLLDEPVTGMNAEEVSEMVSMIRKLRDERGLTSIVVEHNVRVVMSLCDRIAVLSYGKKIAEGLPKEIAANPAVIEAYLGAEQDVT
jgi:branched-chain amino acid transport system ATP-binding protein